LFNEGGSYLGVIASMTLPAISHKTAEHRPGGAIGDVLLDQGLEAMKFDWTYGGYLEQVTSQMGMSRIDGVMLRAVGAFQSDSDGSVSAVEVVMRGRHTMREWDEWKPGEPANCKVSTALAYYKEILDGRALLEAAPLEGIY